MTKPKPDATMRASLASAIPLSIRPTSVEQAVHLDRDFVAMAMTEPHIVAVATRALTATVVGTELEAAFAQRQFVIELARTMLRLVSSVSREVRPIGEPGEPG